jgi:hypothetical protein
MSTATRNRGGWSDSSSAYLGEVKAVAEALREYWPVTLRQVYYRLVAGGMIENDRTAYQKLSRVLTKARLDGLFPWEAIEDRTRSVLSSGGWPDARAFIADETEDYLAGYRRDCLQSQDVALEVWIEKDALSRVCHRAAEPYGVPVVVARGFSSVSYLHEARKRIEGNAEHDQQTIILYFGDLDPSGWEMLPAMLKTLQEEMDLGESVEGVRCALTLEQVSMYDLPRNPDALKDADPRAPKYRDRFGDLAVELDALPPATLEGLVRGAIEGHLDMDWFRIEIDREHDEREQIFTLQERVRQLVKGTS